jgi:hypothetical protein
MKSSGAVHHLGSGSLRHRRAAAPTCVPAHRFFTCASTPSPSTGRRRHIHRPHPPLHRPEPGGPCPGGGAARRRAGAHHRGLGLRDLHGPDLRRAHPRHKRDFLGDRHGPACALQHQGKAFRDGRSSLQRPRDRGEAFCVSASLRAKPATHSAKRRGRCSVRIHEGPLNRDRPVVSLSTQQRIFRSCVSKGSGPHQTSELSIIALILAARSAYVNGLPIRFTPGSRRPWWTMAFEV